MKRLLIIPLLFALALALSCTKGKPAEKEVKGTQLAKVDDITITENVVREEFDMLPAQIQEMFRKEGGMEDIVDELVKKELLYLESKKRGFDRDATFMRKVEDFKKRLMIERLLEEEIEKKTQVSDKEVKEYYDRNKSDFVFETPGGGKGKTVEFEKVKALLEQRVLAEKQKGVFDSYIDSLKKTHKVDINRDAITKAFGNAASSEK